MTEVVDYTYDSGKDFQKAKEKTGETYYQYCTSIPVGTLLAQSWNMELLQEISEMIGS